tara:strand:+ start:170 stop:427 length:258 start_codon:yes stop_codon:yes gene_type:complete
MENFRNRNRRNKDIYTAISGLIANDRGIFFNVLYKAMLEYPSYVMLSDMPQEHKDDILKDMLAYYECNEDYEKCAQLIKLKRSLL